MLVDGPHCGGCLQQTVGQRFVHFSGTDTSGIMLVGDSPWIEEVRVGKPFQGPSGMLLDRLLRRAGVDRNNVLVSNTMCCKPPFLNWTGKHPDSVMAIAQCRPHLDELIERVHPKVIVTLGHVAMQRVIGVSGLDNRQAYTHDTVYGIPAIPTYHPSHLLQGNHKLENVMFYALQKAKEIAVNPNWTRTPVEYLIDPSPEVAKRYLFEEWRGGISVGDPSGSPKRNNVQAAGAREWNSNVTGVDAGNNGAAATLLRWTTKPWQAASKPRIPLLVIDLETPHSGNLDEEEAEDDPSYTIIRVGLSVAPNTALTVPWSTPYIDIIREAVASAAVVIVWNGDGFDLPRMAANEVRWQGEIHDAMWMWHWLQTDLPKSLGFVSPFYTDMAAWKHMSGEDLPYYTACDADAEMRNYLGIRADLERLGKWDRFVSHGLRVGELLRRDHVGRIHIDKVKQDVLKQRLIEEREIALAKLQGIVPDSLKKREVKKAPKKDLETYTIVQTPCLHTMSTQQSFEGLEAITTEPQE